jgi:pimeloyl-ACP methyl ester carboxylesterase
MASVRSPVNRAGWLLAAISLGAAAALLGCSSTGVRKVGAPDWLGAWRASVVTAGELSPRTIQTLRSLDLEATYRHHPAEAAAALHQEAVKEPRPELLFALAEINYLRGQEAEKRDCTQSIACYYLCAGYAYHYLFATADGVRPLKPDAVQGEPGPFIGPLAPADAFDPRFRLACDLYNAGLAKCIRAAQRVGRLDPRQHLNVPTVDGRAFTLSVAHFGFNWKPEEFGKLLLCEDYEAVGLANQHHNYGMGVPLIAVRAAEAPSPSGAFYPREVSFPVTAFFRFEGTVADLAACRNGRLELYNPLAITALEVRSRSIPLETDLTTPLAYFLGHTDLDGLEYKAFLNADKLRRRGGIYFAEPYQPGKIPVLLVHGLLSSPLTWAPLFNDLRADPQVRERFQFWFYFYPTGNPYLAAAADLRQALAHLRADLDPDHKDHALDDLVLVGHSMGGLVAKLLTVDSGNDFWRLTGDDRPFEDLKIKPEARDELRPIFYFARQPAVRRVVFLGTPHHGSKLSPSLPARLAVRFVRLPKALMVAVREAGEENPDLPARLREGRIPTSVDLLAPGAPALELLAARPKPPGVHYHSVIGVAPKSSVLLERFLGDGEEEGDGVVPYTSAHLEGVDSEVVVRADHYHVHQHPLTVLEVRRILLEHARGGTGEILPVKGN